MKLRRADDRNDIVLNDISMNYEIPIEDLNMIYSIISECDSLITDKLSRMDIKTKGVFKDYLLIGSAFHKDVDDDSDYDIALITPVRFSSYIDVDDLDSEKKKNKVMLKAARAMFNITRKHWAKFRDISRYPNIFIYGPHDLYNQDPPKTGIGISLKTGRVITSTGDAIDYYGAE